MPALPWAQRQAVDPGRQYVAMASRLPLKRRRSIPGFLRDTLAIRRLRPLMGQTRFEFLPLPGSDLPLTWDQMKAPVRN